MVAHALSVAHSAEKAGASPLGDRLEYRAYVALLFPLSLAVVLLRRMRGRKGLSSVQGRHSNPWTEAREMTHRAAPWVFMGR